ncbi:hypothetical protein LJC54_09900 [Parabacteroides sp. OttesenSCG-928-J18]|nr:hypothetical protein [Parabacteroides sp. OttesenSCG-928-J18]
MNLIHIFDTIINQLNLNQMEVNTRLGQSISRWNDEKLADILSKLGFDASMSSKELADKAKTDSNLNIQIQTILAEHYPPVQHTPRVPKANIKPISGTLTPEQINMEIQIRQDKINNLKAEIASYKESLKKADKAEEKAAKFIENNPELAAMIAKLIK